MFLYFFNGIFYYIFPFMPVIFSKYSKEIQLAQKKEKYVAEVHDFLTSHYQESQTSYIYDHHTLHNVVNILSLMVWTLDKIFKMARRLIWPFRPTPENGHICVPYSELVNQSRKETERVAHEL